MSCSVARAAQLLGVSPATVRRRLARGEIPGQLIPRQRGSDGRILSPERWEVHLEAGEAGGGEECQQEQERQELEEQEAHQDLEEQEAHQDLEEQEAHQDLEEQETPERSGGSMWLWILGGLALVGLAAALGSSGSRSGEAWSQQPEET